MKSKISPLGWFDAIVYVALLITIFGTIVNNPHIAMGASTALLVYGFTSFVIYQRRESKHREFYRGRLPCKKSSKLTYDRAKHIIKMGDKPSCLTMHDDNEGE